MGSGGLLRMSESCHVFRRIRQSLPIRGLASNAPRVAPLRIVHLAARLSTANTKNPRDATGRTTTRHGQQIRTHSILSQFLVRRRFVGADVLARDRQMLSNVAPGTPVFSDASPMAVSVSSGTCSRIGHRSSV